MEKIIEFFKDFTIEKLIELLTEWYVLIFIVMILLLIGLFIFTLITIRTKKLKKVCTYEDNNVRYFSIHFEKDYVYSVDKRTFRTLFFIKHALSGFWLDFVLLLLLFFSLLLLKVHIAKCLNRVAT